MVLSVQPKEFIYTHCTNCGLNCVEPGIENFSKIQEVFFPNAWRGNLCNNDGLQILDPDGNEYKVINQEGSFCIRFQEGKNPQIIAHPHECSTLSNQIVNFWGKEPPAKIKSATASEIKSENKKGSIFLGICRLTREECTFDHSLDDYEYVSDYIEKLSGTQITITLPDKRILKISASVWGISINGTLLKQDLGTYRLEVLPGKEKYLFTKI